MQVMAQLHLGGGVGRRQHTSKRDARWRQTAKGPGSSRNVSMSAGRTRAITGGGGPAVGESCTFSRVLQLQATPWT